MVQLDHDDEIGPLHGMYGSVEAINMAVLTAFLCFLERVIGPIRVHVDNKGQRFLELI